MSMLINPRARLLLLCLCMATLQLSCGQAAQEDTAQPAPAAVDPAGQKVLFWYTHSDTREQALLDLIDLFNTTNPHGIEVRGEHIGSHAEIYKKMLLGIQGGPMPQITEAYQNQIRAYYKAGAIVDLTPYLGSALFGLTEQERADFIPGFLQQDNVGGAQTALLPNRSMEVLYYNQDWLQELGADGPPADWETFERLCHAAVEQPFSGSRGERSYGLALDRDTSRLAAMIFSRGGDVMNPEHTAYTFDTPETRASLELIRDLVQSGAAVLTVDDAERAAFAAGEALFAQRSSSGVPQFASAVTGGAGFAWNTAGVPASVEQPRHNVYGASLAVCQSSPEQQLASWLFIRWFVRPEQQDRWASASGYFPVRRSIAHRLGQHFRVAYNLLQYGRPEPSVGGYEPVRALALAALGEIVEEGADLGPVLQRLEAEANKTLKPYQ